MSIRRFRTTTRRAAGTYFNKLLEGPLGRCELRDRKILIDIEPHRNDREVRATMLHEMAHAAAGRCSVAHGYKFWEQIEGLLAERAPITISCAETPGLQILANAVPRRFPLARKAVERLEARRIRELEELDFDGDEEVIDEEYLIERFDDAATDYLAKRTSVPPDE